MRNHLIHILLIFLTALLVFPLWAASGRSGPATPKTFIGEVTDTICAQSGSHDEMMAKMPGMGHDHETCTKKCAEIGAKYVLYDQVNKTVYSLDDQTKMEAFAGRRVRVAGTLDGSEIKVAEVQRLS